MGALLVVVTLLLYVPVLHHDFIYYDDRGYVTDNVHVQTGLTLNKRRVGFYDLRTVQLAPTCMAFPYAGLPGVWRKARTAALRERHSARG